MQTQMINLSLPKDLLKALDHKAEKELKTRSEALRDAIRTYIKNQEEWEDLLNYSQKQAKKLGIKSEADVDKLVEEYRQGK